MFFLFQSERTNGSPQGTFLLFVNEWVGGSIDLKIPHFLKLKSCFGQVGLYLFL